ncbi:MAG: hypothetical protein ACPGNV_08610 [Mangrovicoccus sp.]
MWTTLSTEIRQSWRQLVIFGVMTAVLSQVLMMIALVLRFQAFPNYVVFYNWPGNVWRIIKGTPAWSDMPAIIAQEWLIEIGQMTYDYGLGLSIWSLNVVPGNLLLLFVMGAMMGLCVQLMRRPDCSLAAKRGAGAATGLGAVLVAMTNATMSWVVCCATPNWVVGLAMMGLGVSTSLALEPLGLPLALSGFALLSVAICVLAWRKSRQALDLKEAAHA